MFDNEIHSFVHTSIEWILLGICQSYSCVACKSKPNALSIDILKKKAGMNMNYKKIKYGKERIKENCDFLIWRKKNFVFF